MVLLQSSMEGMWSWWTPRASNPVGRRVSVCPEGSIPSPFRQVSRTRTLSIFKKIKKMLVVLGEFLQVYLKIFIHNTNSQLVSDFKNIKVFIISILYHFPLSTHTHTSCIELARNTFMCVGGKFFNFQLYK